MYDTIHVQVQVVELHAVGVGGLKRRVLFHGIRYALWKLCAQPHEESGHPAAAQAQHQVQSALLLDVVVSEGAAVLELLARKDEALLVRGNALFVLDLGLDGIDGVRGLDLEGDGLACQRFDKHLHASAQAQEKFQTARCAAQR